MQAYLYKLRGFSRINKQDQWRKDMYRKRFSLLALLVASSMVLSSCGAEPAASPTATTAPAVVATNTTAPEGETPTAMSAESPTAMAGETPGGSMDRNRVGAELASAY